MKHLLFLFLSILLLAGCSKDDNPTNSNNSGYPVVNGWYQIYSKADSVNTLMHSQEIGYVAAAKFNKVWLQFDYKIDSSFSSIDSSFVFHIDYAGVPYIYEALLRNVTNRNWLNYSDSGSAYLDFSDGTLWYSVHGIPYERNTFIRNLVIYMR